MTWIKMLDNSLMSATAADLALLTWLDPQPSCEEIPLCFPSPFDDVAPHPLARQAALDLQSGLGRGWIAPGVPTSVLERAEGGKMFGVLVVEALDGRVGVLRAFSGQLAGMWNVPGWVPPIFDSNRRGEVEPELEHRVKELTAVIDALAESPEFRRSRVEHSVLLQEMASRRAAIREEFAGRIRLRHARRAELHDTDRMGKRLLDAESRKDDMERRRLEAALREEEVALSRPFRTLERRLLAMERLRRLISRRVMQAIHDTYMLRNRRGGTATLRDLFIDGEPPWGAGDCAAPKLITAALRDGLKPLALAEFWWGPPPPGGGRVEGMFFPACRTKCGPILPFLLDGLDVAPRRTVRPDVPEWRELVTLYEDDRLVVVEKPAGMLSVPARDVAVTDSVVAWLRKRYGRAERVLVVHRLDLDTSGVLLASLDLEAYERLQAQFAARTVQKRYVAWVDGDVGLDGGTISVPIRLDLDQRPRQVVDFVHGREAITDWKVLERRDGRTKVAFFPRTGRTHQLRVHAAHPSGLGAPITGDRLYGSAGERLLLHAEALSFRNLDGRKQTITSPVPF